VYVFATIDHAVSPGAFGVRDGGLCQAGCASPRGPSAPRAGWSVIRISWPSSQAEGGGVSL